MASLRLLFRPATRASVRFTTTTRQALRPLSTSSRLRAIIDEKGPIDPPTRGELGVGEIQGASFRIEPLRREGEDDKTMRARLVYQSRKRGTLESDLLLSTFAGEKLPQMTRAQMEEYDRFLDENDWDIYYWATQETPENAGAASDQPISDAAKAAAEVQDSSSADYAGGAEAAMALDSATSDITSTATDSALESSSEDIAAETSGVAGGSSNVSSGPAYSSAGRVPTSTAELFTPEDDPVGKNAAAAAMAAAEEPYRKPGEGEWAQTVGTFKPAYRPVPARWRDSEVLKLLREHVKSRSAGGNGQGGGMGFMPSLNSKDA